MDIKRLYDLLCEQDIDWGDDSIDVVAQYGDVVTYALMADPDWLQDFWLDFLADADYGLVTKDIIEPLNGAASAHNDLKGMDDRLNPLWPASTMMLYANTAGSRILNILLDAAKAHVQDNLPFWFGDALGYHGDMMEGMAADAADSHLMARQEAKHDR